MDRIRDALASFCGLALTIVCGAAGCVMLPPAFTNTWRCAIFVGLLVCYVVGFLEGRKAMRKAAADKLAKAEDEFRRMLDSAKFEHASQIAEKNHEIDRLTTQLEAAKARTREDVLEAMRDASSARPAESVTDDDIAEAVDRMVEEKASEMDAELASQVSTIERLNASEMLVLDLVLAAEERGNVFTTKTRGAALAAVEDAGIVVVKPQDRGVFDFDLEKTYECSTAIGWRRAIEQTRDVIGKGAETARQARDEGRRKKQATAAARRCTGHRRAAREVPADNKLLLLYLADLGTLDVSIEDHKLSERLGDAEPLVTRTEVGWQRYQLELSDEGAAVVEDARDILQKASPGEAYLWWDANADKTWEPRMPG